MGHLQELVDVLAPLFKKRTTAAWLERLERAGVPAGPVLDIGQMHEDPQALAREMIVTVPHTHLGDVKTIGHPVKYSATPGGVTRGAPLLGEHTRGVLQEFGYSEKEIEDLITSGAVIAA